MIAKRKVSFWEYLGVLLIIVVVVAILLILLCEVQHSAVPEFNIDDPMRFGPDKHILAPRHTGGSNYLLADGHAKWFRPLATASFWYRDGHRHLSANAAAVLRNAHG